jgi:hypothetical protein
MKHYHYKSFDLQITSEIECPELCPGDNCVPDVTIQYGQVPEIEINDTEDSFSYQISPKQFLLDIKDTARYCVSGGDRITIQRDEKIDYDAIRVFLLGSAFGMLLYQRGILPLHGSAIHFNNAGVIFVGQSGAGKSTLASAFGKRDYQILADDVSAITFSDDGLPYVTGGTNHLKMWEDSLNYIGEDPQTLKNVHKEYTKFKVDMGSQFCPLPTPVRYVYMLTPDSNPDIRITPLNPNEKFNALVNNAYRIELIDEIMYKKMILQNCAKMANRVVIKRVERPTRSFMLEELADRIEEDFSTDEVFHS